MCDNMIEKNDIVNAIKRLGIENGDVVLVHSSLKSMGYVNGGAHMVIDAFLEVLGKNGTLAMPTLIQKDFEHAYEMWYIDKPSDTGHITEVFRKYPGVSRSDQATHSVAATGKRARELTEEHTAFGPRYGIFGDTAFSQSSPWQKLYDWNAEVVLLGVDMTKNTGKHLVEYMLVEDALNSVKDTNRLPALRGRIRDYYNRMSNENLLWPFFDGMKHQTAAEQAGLLQKTQCGNATLISYCAGDTARLLERLVKEKPDEWLSPEMIQWFQDCENSC